MTRAKAQSAPSGFRVEGQAYDDLKALERRIRTHGVSVLPPDVRAQVEASARPISLILLARAAIRHLRALTEADPTAPVMYAIPAEALGEPLFHRCPACGVAPGAAHLHDGAGRRCALASDGAVAAAYEEHCRARDRAVAAAPGGSGG